MATLVSRRRTGPCYRPRRVLLPRVHPADAVLRPARHPRGRLLVRAAPPWSPTSEPLDWDLSAADALRLLRADAHPAALLGTWAGGSDIVVAEPTDVRSDPESVLAALDESWPAGAAADLGPAVFGGGWVGF